MSGAVRSRAALPAWPAVGSGGDLSRDVHVNAARVAEDACGNSTAAGWVCVPIAGGELLMIVHLGPIFSDDSLVNSAAVDALLSHVGRGSLLCPTSIVSLGWSSVLLRVLRDPIGSPTLPSRHRSMSVQLFGSHLEWRRTSFVVWRCNGGCHSEVDV